MKKIAIIGGSGLKEYNNNNALFVNRHPENIPPHKIKHADNLKKISEAGIKKVLGINSVGSLKTSIRPGTLVLPDDYINLHNIGTVHHESAIHIVPEIDQGLRRKIIKCSEKLKIKLFDHGVYYQTKGPRFETKAEINMIKHYADVVGMTMGSEATIAQEMGLSYASLCVVDNYANGIAGELDANEWKNAQKNNHNKLIKLLDSFLA